MLMVAVLVYVNLAVLAAGSIDAANTSVMGEALLCRTLNTVGQRAHLRCQASGLMAATFRFNYSSTVAGNLLWWDFGCAASLPQGGQVSAATGVTPRKVGRSLSKVFAKKQASDGIPETCTLNVYVRVVVRWSTAEISGRVRPWAALTGGPFA